MQLLAACSILALSVLQPAAAAAVRKDVPEHPTLFMVENFYARGSKDGTDANSLYKFDITLNPTGRRTHCEAQAWTTKGGDLKPLAPTVRVACEDRSVSFEISRDKQAEAMQRNDLDYVGGHIWLTLWWDTDWARRENAARGRAANPVPDWGIVRAQEKVDSKYIVQYPEKTPHTLYEVYMGEGDFLMTSITWHTKEPPPLCIRDECGIIRPNGGDPWDIVSVDDPPLRRL